MNRNLFTSPLSSKRGLDLGLTRGNAGNLQAKQLVGLTAANLPNGPGKRRKRFSVLPTLNMKHLYSSFI